MTYLPYVLLGVNHTDTEILSVCVSVDEAQQAACNEILRC